MGTTPSTENCEMACRVELRRILPLIEFCSQKQRVEENEFVEMAPKLINTSQGTSSPRFKAYFWKECFRILSGGECRLGCSNNDSGGRRGQPFFLDKCDVNRICKHLRKYRLTEVGILDLVEIGNVCAAQTFSKAEYCISVLKKPTKFYRAGKSSQPLGQYFTQQKPNTVVEIRKTCAVKDNWDSEGLTFHEVFSPEINTLFTFTFPAGTVIFEGPAAPLSSFMPVDDIARGIFVGGGKQVLLVRPWEFKQRGHPDGGWVDNPIVEVIERGDIWELLDDKFVIY
jgi:hypothetical protein